MIFNIILGVAIAGLAAWAGYDEWKRRQKKTPFFPIPPVKPEVEMDRMSALASIEKLLAWCKKNKAVETEAHIRKAGQSLYEER